MNAHEIGDYSYHLIKAIAKKTDNNMHTESVMVLANFLENGKSQKILRAIMDLHLLYGSMPTQLQELREFERKELLKQVAQKHGKEAAEKINSAF